MHFHSSFQIATIISIVHARITSLDWWAENIRSTSAYEGTQSLGKNAVLWDIITIIASGVTCDESPKNELTHAPYIEDGGC